MNFYYSNFGSNNIIQIHFDWIPKCGRPLDNTFKITDYLNDNQSKLLRTCTSNWKTIHFSSDTLKSINLSNVQVSIRENILSSNISRGWKKSVVSPRSIAAGAFMLERNFLTIKSASRYNSRINVTREQRVPRVYNSRLGPSVVSMRASEKYLCIKGYIITRV